MGYSTTDLLARVRRGARIKSTDATYTTAVILDMADAVIHRECVPPILTLHADYWLTYQDLAVTASRDTYPIPTRATLSGLESVEYLNADKDEKEWLRWKHVRDMDMTSTGEPEYHGIKDDSLVVYPTPASTTGYLRIRYHYLPSNLVATTACMLITGGIDTGVLTGVSLAGWTTALKYDIVAAESPFSLINSDLTASAVNVGTSITFTLTDLDTNRLASGTYYVCLAGETCFPMIPKTLHDLAADMVTAKIREEIGDEGYGQKYAANREDLRGIINATVPRKESETKPSKNRNSMYRYF